MKKWIKWIKWIGLVLMILLVSTACDLLPLGQTPEACLRGFFGEAQADNWDAMIEYIYPDATNYDDFNALWFEDAFESTDVDYSIISSSGSTYKVEVNYPISGVKTETYTFWEDANGDSLIYSFTVTTE